MQALNYKMSNIITRYKNSNKLFKDSSQIENTHENHTVNDKTLMGLKSN